MDYIPEDLQKRTEEVSNLYFLLEIDFGDLIEVCVEKGLLALDGSSIKGFRSIETSDMFFYPDLKTFAILPWRSDDETKVARFICDIHNADGTPFEGCPRCNLKRMIAKTIIAENTVLTLKIFGFSAILSTTFNKIQFRIIAIR